VCEDCGLVQHRGRWSSGAPPLTELRGGRCPACQRIRDRYPAGTIRLHPDLLEHRAEVLRLARNLERAERSEHPLERLMGVERADDHLVITTTGVHLARRIARHLARRFHRRARIRYADGEERMHADLA
jgi:hypothetical protein